MCGSPAVEPSPAGTPPAGTRVTWAGVPAEVVVAVGVAVALAAVMFVVRVVRHVTTVPPTLPLPLHWLMLIGIAGLTVEAVPTVQATPEPPPVAEPLHCETVAPVVEAGLGSQTTPVPPPPVAEPTHWLTVAAVTGCAPGVSALMLFVMSTSQLIGCAASLSDPLHCFTSVTRLGEEVVNVPFADEQGPRVQFRVTVVVELVVVPLIVLTTLTAHVSPVVAPSALGPWPLHWSIVMVAACAVEGDRAAAAKENALASSSAISAACQVSLRPAACAGAVAMAIVMRHVFLERT
jgi:hypothetical protein